MTGTPPLLVIANAEAGTADQDAIDAATSVLRERTEVEVAATSSPDELDHVLADAGDRWIVPAGGDGSLHAVVAALHRTDRLTGRTLGLLPLGTGNDFARTIGIPLAAEDAARAILAGTPRPMDLIVDETDGVVVNNVHLGAGADAGRRGARWKRRLGGLGVGKVNLGRLGYPIGAAITALNAPTLRVRVEVDDETVIDIDERTLMVVLGNGASVGGGTEIAPDADPEDGRIDVLLATPDSPVAKLRYAAGVLRGRHPEHKDVPHLAGPAGPGQRRGVLDQRRRRAVRTTAPPQLAAGAGGVLAGRAGYGCDSGLSSGAGVGRRDTRVNRCSCVHAGARAHAWTSQHRGG